MVFKHHLPTHGDFNVGFFEHASSTCLRLEEITSSFGLTQVVDEPTHITDTSSTLIDHVYMSNPAVCSGVSVEAPLGSANHNSIVVQLSFVKCKPRSVKRRVWLYQKADFEGLNDHLMDSLPDKLHSTMDVNNHWECFQDTIMSGASDFIPNFTTS